MSLHLAFHHVKKITVHPTHRFQSNGQKMSVVEITIEDENGKQDIKFFSYEDLDIAGQIVKPKPFAVNGGQL